MVGSTTYGLSEFNGLSTSDAMTLLTRCIAIPTWTAALAEARPYASVDELVTHADALADRWTVADVTAALSDRPRLGGPIPSDNTFSPSEQAQVLVASTEDDAAARVRARIHSGNVAYEGRFGMIFMIRAAGRTGAEVLAELDRRLTNDPGDEILEATRELREITLLRLRQVVHASTPGAADFP
jgi:2-oxo-4-hydroxy-4-carboxy-5-ureidoimidazoline decarboxylase